MKKTILSIAIIAAAFLAASCQKENLQENIAPEGSASVFTATIESGANTKTTVERIEGTPAKYKTKWESGDQISINGVTYSATPDGTDATKATFTKVVEASNPTPTYKAYFPAAMYDGTKATLPASYTYADGKYNMPMYAQSESTNLSFKNLCGVLAITVSNADFASVSSIEVSSDHQMNGEFTATPDGALSFESKTLTDDDKKVTLTFTSAKTIAVGGSATFYIPVPAGTHNPLTIKVSDGSTTKTKTTTKSGGVTVERNNVYPIVLNYPSGTLSGVFSISATKQVHFSKGNLWYGKVGSATTATFNFEANQYDFRTYAGKNSCINGASKTTGTPTSHWGLFGWVGASSSFTGDVQYGVSTSTTTSDYGNVASEALKSDWGNTIDNSGTWRTLTTAEWQYLFNDRTDAASKVGYATVGGVNGIIILPDNFTDPMKNKGNGAFVSKSSTGWTQNVYTSGGNWNAMETAGAVFLPAAGYRGGSDVIDVGVSGLYWSSTAHGSNNAYNVGFNSSTVKPDLGVFRYLGYSVRLVTESK